MDTSLYGENIMTSLRRIIRAIDLYNRNLGARFRLTVPQLVCLRQLSNGGPNTPGRLANHVHLSQATVTGILNRLEDRGLVLRERKETDRRRVTISLTEKGCRVVASAPMPLQDDFFRRLSALSREEQASIDQVLMQIAAMMENREIDKPQ